MSASTSGWPHSGSFLLVAERGGEADRVLHRGRLDHEATVLVALELHAVRADRIHHVGVLRFVEQPLDQARGVKPKVAADQLAAGRAAGGLSDARADQQAGGGQRAGRDHDHVRLHRCALTVGTDVLDARGLRAAASAAILDRHPAHVAIGAQLQPVLDPRRMDVGVERGLARVGRAALQAGAAAHAVRVRVRHHGLELGPERLEPRHHGPDALLPVGALAHAQSLLHLLQVRQQIRLGERLAEFVGESRGLVPLLVVLLTGAQRHLGVDRGRAAHAAAPEQDQRRLVGRGRFGERRRPPQLVVGPRLPAHVIGGRLVRTGLEQQHAPAAVRQLARHHATAGTGADHDHFVAVAHSVTPR